MGDLQRIDACAAILTGRSDHYGAGPILSPSFLALLRFTVPQVGIADDEAWLPLPSVTGRVMSVLMVLLVMRGDLFYVQVVASLFGARSVAKRLYRLVRFRSYQIDI